jgi:hypothetical protein
MSDVPAAVLAETFKQQTGLLVLETLVVDHDDLAAAFRLVNNPENIMHAGNEYEACGLVAVPPRESDDGFGVGRLTIENVTRWFTPSVRSLSGPFEVTLTLVGETDLAASPPELDTVVKTWLPLTFRNLRYGAFSVTGDISYDGPLRLEFPALRFDPVNFPGLFNERA